MTAWCADCRRKVTVDETATNGHQTRAGEVEYATDYLACGHTIERGHQVIAPAPGAPYAGLVVAPTVRRRGLGAPISPDPWKADQ